MKHLIAYWRNLNYSRKFSYLFYMVISFFVFFVIATNIIFLKEMTNQEYKNNQDNILKITDTIDREFVSIDFFSYKVIDNNRIQTLLTDLNKQDLDFQDEISMRTDLRHEVYTLASYERNVNNFYLFDANRENLDSTVVETVTFFDDLNSDKIIAELGDKPQKGQWYLSTDGTRALLARHIFSKDTLDLQGTIIVSLDTSFMVNAIQNVGLYNDSDYFIIEYNDQYYPLGSDIPDAIRIALEDQQRLTRSVERINHRDYVIASGRFNNDQMRLTALLPRNKVLENIILLETIILSVFFLLVVFMVTFSQRMIDSLVHPINQLAKKMSSFEKESHNFQSLITDKDSDIVNRPDEVGALYTKFDQLIEEINQLIEENYQSKILYQEIQFRALQSQLDPHFLYNTLDSINWLAVNNNQMEISNMVTSLATLFRKKLSHTNPLHTIAEEIQLIDAYLMIQKFRFNDRLRFDYQIEDELTQLVIPRLIIQPLIENSLKYGLEKMNHPCNIKLTIKKVDQHLLITVYDNGPGFPNSQDPAEKPRSSGVGIKNIKERIKLYYGSRANLTIQSEPFKETKITIILPTDFTEVLT